MTRYLAGLWVAGLGLCGGGFLIVAAVAFGSWHEGGYWHAGAGLVNLVSGAGIAFVSLVTAVAWAAAWRRRMRFDGVIAVPFPEVSRRQARRNRRELARDMRHAVRQDKKAARAARRSARESMGLPDLMLPPGVSVAVMPDIPLSSSGDAAEADSALPADEDDGCCPGGVGHARPAGAGQGGGLGTARAGAGHDGASAADVLGELRALLVPLLSAAGLDPATVSRSRPRLEEWKPRLREWPTSLPEWQAPSQPGLAPGSGPGERTAAGESPAPAGEAPAGQSPAGAPPLPRRLSAPAAGSPGASRVPRQGAGPAESGPLRRLTDGEDTWW